MSDHTASGTPAGDDLLARIGEAHDDLPPIPERLRAVASEAFSWRRADSQLAELLFDSADADLVGVRGTVTGRRAFRFGAGDVVIRVHLTEETLVVMVEPPMSVVCRVVNGAGAVEHRTDDLGEVVVDAPELPMRLEVELPGAAIVTPWITA